MVRQARKRKADQMFVGNSSALHDNRKTKRHHDDPDHAAGPDFIATIVFQLRARKLSLIFSVNQA